MNEMNARALSRTHSALRSPLASVHRQSPPSPVDSAVPTKRGNVGSRDMDNNGHGSDEDRLLTTEDLTMLQLVAEGLPLNAVARRMQMSPRTVRRRLRNICDRLDVTHPIQAIAWAARRGLI